MIQELVSLSENLRENKTVRYIHDALNNVPVSITCEIDRKGNFKQFIVSGDKKDSIAEALTSKKGSARLLIDKPEELLKYGDKANAKHKLFREKLKDYSHLSMLSSVVAFYGGNKTKGVQAACKAFPRQVDEKLRNGNIAFKLTNDKKWIHDEPKIRKAIIDNYENTLKVAKLSRFPKCSICGSSNYPVTDEFPHGMIKRVPDGQSSGCALVSYNEKVFESYDLKGNENASICTHCARAYVDALNWLLSNGVSRKNEKSGKEYFDYRNRKNISDDTAVVFWLRDGICSQELDWLDEPPDESRIREMIKSIDSGQEALVKKAKTDKFYAITLSGAAGRIAVRDWIETSLPNLRANLINWFENISIGEYNKDKKIVVTQLPRFYNLVASVKSKGGKDAQHGRIGAALWKCAVLGVAPPLWLLSAVLNRIRTEQSVKPEKGKVLSHWEMVLSERITLLKLILNRNNNKGGSKYMSTLDESNKNIAYICGRLFAVLESIQYHASGGNLNAGIRERFFSSASTTPSTAFGRLMKLSQHHLSKIRGEKPGLAVNLDKQMQELMCNIESSRFPVIFSLEDQASFAIGYYHQRQHDFAKKQNIEGETNNE